MRNRIRFVTCHPYRPIVRYDVFGRVGAGRVIGDETIGWCGSQLPLPEAIPMETSPNVKNMARREFVYVPWEESA